MQHKADKNYDKIYYLPIPRRDLNHVEKEFINALNPPLNRQILS